MRLWEKNKAKKINHKTTVKILTILSIVFMLTTIIIPTINSQQTTIIIKKTNNETNQTKNTINKEEQQTNIENIKNIASGYYGKGYRYNIQGWVYVHVEGEPYERGYQYGYLASEEIIDMINRWSYWGRGVKVMNLFQVKDPEKWWNLLKDKAVDTFLKYYPEEYTQEMKGVADGIKAKNGQVFGRSIEFEDILTLNEGLDTWLSYEYFWNKIRLPRHILNTIGIRPLDILSRKGIGCSAFIATGDATKDGGIVIAHSTEVPFNYLSSRFNMILDVTPNTGNRFIMACVPGVIWSMDDYYQNEKGLVITETTYAQGKWKEVGIPIGVRARTAIQYSNNIDDVISYLKKGNNGLYMSEWLIGDTKTNEIASLELALYNNPVKRTFNGFYWSCNIPHDKKVRWEIYGTKVLFPKIMSLFVSNRDIKFMELSEQYYGEINIENAKKIMATYPICKHMSDAKITSSAMMKNLGMWAFMGNPNGSLWKPSDELIEKFIGITDLPASGWVDLYPLNSEPNYLPATSTNVKDGNDGIVKWKYDSEDKEGNNVLNSIITGDIICTSTGSGKICALNAKAGEHIWNIDLGEQIITSSSLDKTVFIGTETGLAAVEQETGSIKWKQNIGKISSKPVIYNNLVITGCDDGKVYAFDTTSGNTEWSYSFTDEPYISEVEKNRLYVGSGDSCYSFDVENKKIIWSYKTEGKITVSPRVKDNVVYFGSWDANVYALDYLKGEPIWSFRTGWGVDTTPYVTDDTIYIGSLDNKFYSLDKHSGEINWYYTCNSAIHSSPLVYGECVFFGCDDGRLYSLDKHSGELAWSFAPEYFITNDNPYNYITTPILSDPVEKDGMIYINVKGTVYALDSQTEEVPPVYQTITTQNDNNLYILSIVCMSASLICLALVILRKRVIKK